MVYFSQLLVKYVAADNSLIMHADSPRQDDANPKIWTRRSNVTLDYQFLYLSHSHPVMTISWRKSFDQGSNVIMTNCRDRVTRLWSQFPSEMDEPFKFVMSATLTLRPFTNFEADDFFACHWLHSSELLAGFTHRNAILGHSKGDVCETYQKKTLYLQKFLQEYHEMIFNVGKDGSLRVWGLQVRLRSGIGWK
jgi:hypothetical protein